MIIKILTLNVGLLDYKILDTIVFSNPFYSTDRIQYIPSAILSVDCDIVVLQECYDEKHFKFINNKIKSVYPYFARKDQDRFILKLHNGLVVFSKFPIKNVNIIPYTTLDIVEKYFASKSLLTVELDIDKKKIVLFNVHLTAGSLDPESSNASKGRIVQINELMAVVNYYYNKNFIVLLAGDFNSGPQRSDESYNFLIMKDFVDSYVLSQKKHTDHPEHTWSPNNIIPNFHHNESDRIDHIFFHKKDNIEVLETKIVFHEPNINVINEKNEIYNCTLSDHNGLLTTLKIN